MDEGTYKDALRYVEHYQLWRQGHDERTMAEAGIEPGRVTWALNEVVRELKRARVDLQKCYKTRKAYHSEILRLRTELKRREAL